MLASISLVYGFYMGKHMDLAERFWSKVDIVEGENSCWPWTAGRRKKTGEEYGQFKWAAPGKKPEAVSAARVAFYLSHGYLPRVACHHCDNPPCCRPDHIYDGTHQTNGLDKATRGRARGKSDQRGEANDSAVLTDDIVIDARRRSKAGETQRVIAARHGVDVPTLAYAIRGKTWSHIDKIETPHIRHAGGGSRLTEDDVRAIRADALEHDLKTIAARRGMKYHTIYAIVRRKSWAHVE